jgi:hypothetical protein
MSLDVDLMVVQPTSVYSANITHNLGKMADAVDVGEGRTLYEILWRPDEHGYVYAREIVDCLHNGLKELSFNPEKYRKFAPENGWGSYEGLIEFVRKYHAACMETPDAELRVCR